MHSFNNTTTYHMKKMEQQGFKVLLEQCKTTDTKLIHLMDCPLTSGPIGHDDLKSTIFDDNQDAFEQAM